MDEYGLICAFLLSCGVAEGAFIKSALVSYNPYRPLIMRYLSCVRAVVVDNAERTVVVDNVEQTKQKATTSAIRPSRRASTDGCFLPCQCHILDVHLSQFRCMIHQHKGMCIFRPLYPNIIT